MTVTITDSAARLYGFQMSARPQSSNSTTQAGRFDPSDTFTFVLCENGSERSGSGNCGNGLEFIEHRTARSTGSFEFDWTAPATDVGTVNFYVAANAANANGQNTGDRIYTAGATLTPRAAAGPRPTVSQGGVAEAFNNRAGLASNTWIAIYGTNLATQNLTWDNAIQNGQLPTTLGGVSVKVNNRDAAVYFISAGQINVLAPADDATGNISVVVTNANGASDPITVSKSASLPAIYAPFARGAQLFATVVENSTGAILGTAGVEPRATRPVRPGDVIQIYATGLGPTNPDAPTDRVLPAPLALRNTATVRFNQTNAEVFGAALVNPGLFQINVRVPDVPDGDVPLTVEIGGSTSPNNVFITVRR